ncbi:transcriptional regulator domain-containing protein [Aestuariibius insulae]|uniref:transcriptional regulator domain-containing protein n=1 Tax=Aestuariibius insulae TaxID=2058287 RepID=UPI00345E64AA
MSETGAWRIPAAYRYALDLDDAQFAWEFLRRNPAFREDVERQNAGTSPRSASPTQGSSPNSDPESEQESPHRLPARWGLHFRAELASPRRRRRPALLAA